MSRLLVGTSGWSYPSWQPGFYPAGIDRSDFLGFYARQFGAVELNATKYRLPSQAQFESWAGQVPDGFRFAVKAPEQVERRLDVFQERVLALGDRLGCVRVVVDRPRDDGFLELLLGSAEPTIRYALDLRHPSWSGVEESLRAVGWARVDDLADNGGWAYLRFRELAYDGPGLDAVAARVRGAVAAGTEMYAFFRHDGPPAAPRAALRLAALLSS